MSTSTSTSTTRSTSRSRTVPVRPPQAGPDAATVPDHVRLGVGARFTLTPAADDVVPVILGALAVAGLAAPGVHVRTDDVSTLLRGSEQDVATYLEAAVRAAVERTPSGHVTATLAFSRGCPGEVGCDLAPDALVEVAPVHLEASGLPAAAHWALYPLGTPDVMAPIARAVETAQAAGTWGGAEHFATRLEGDLADVLGTVVDTWAQAGARVAHVAAHATVSVGSPSRGGAR